MGNPINKVKKYINNVNKELGQLQAASEASLRAKGGPNEKKVDENTKKQRSEFFGALLQARRYDAGVKTTTATVNKLYRPSSDK